jgi:hypothetical protein
VTDSIEGRRNVRNEFGAEAFTLFLVPDGRASKFIARVRV